MAVGDNENQAPPFLLQARRYVRAAKWGFDHLVSAKPSGAAFHFHIIGIFAILRAVQSVTLKFDSTLTPKHSAAVAQWKQRTDPDIPELAFIMEARNRALKDGTLAAWATNTEGGQNYDLAFTTTMGTGTISRRDFAPP